MGERKSLCERVSRWPLILLQTIDRYVFREYSNVLRGVKRSLLPWQQCIIFSLNEEEVVIFVTGLNGFWPCCQGFLQVYSPGGCKVVWF